MDKMHWSGRLIRVWENTASGVRGALLAKGPDPSLGEVHRGSCSGNIHMEDEKVEVKVQEDEVEDGRDKMKSAKRGSNMTHGWDDAHKHLEPMSCETLIMSSDKHEKKVTCEVYYLHLPSNQLHHFSHCHHEELEEEDECHLW